MIQEIGDGIALRKRVLANLETGPLFPSQNCVVIS